MIIGYGDKGFERAVGIFERKIIREIKRIIAETAEMAVSQMKALAPVDTSALKDSIGVEYEKGGLRAIIQVTAAHALYIEYGTGIYSTHPEGGRQTPWVYFSEDLGRWVYTHGIEPQPYWHPSIDVAFKYFRDEMNKIG
jgi:hypothetical protein